MAEAVKQRKAKIKTSDLVAQLEQISVPDYSLSDSDPGGVDLVENTSVIKDASDLSSEAVSNQVNVVETQENSSVACVSDEGLKSIGQGLHPLTGAADISTDTNVTPTAPSAISVPDEFCLPPAVELARLRNLYVNKPLDNVISEEVEFLHEVTCNVAIPYEEKHPFERLLNQYVHFWNSWRYAQDRSNSVCSELETLADCIWKICHRSSSVSGKCNDGATVSLTYDYDEAEMDCQAAEELAETERIVRWIAFEELPMTAFELARSRNEIHEYLLHALSCSSTFRDMTTSERVQLIGIDLDGDTETHLRELRLLCTLLFDALRQNLSEVGVGSRLEQHIRDWLLLTAGTMVRKCRRSDHTFLLMHLLRLPSRAVRHLLGLLNPPDPADVVHRSTSIAEFLHQPQVELLMTLFAISLRPVRERSRFVPAPRHSSLTDDNIPPSDPPWIVLDSGGESDLEGNEETPVKWISEPSRFDTPPPLPRRFSIEESPTYVSPRDLGRLLRQLNLERLIRSLTADSVPEIWRNVESPTSSLLTLIAFAERFMDLIEQCSMIYAGNLEAPRPDSHLGDWRFLAKRLAHLVSLLVGAVGSHARSLWITHWAQTPDAYQLMAQYDAFCLRAARCLLAGCGLPSTHQHAVRLVCWRNLASLFPLGLMATHSKNLFLHLTLSSVLPNWKPVPLSQILSVPMQVIEPLHRSLLTIGLNYVGLEAFVQVLGNLAAVECRPICVPSSSAPTYQLPSLEADLVRCIVGILFGLTVFHAGDSTSANSSLLIGSMPIVPGCGRSQLVTIGLTHVSVALPLIFDLILKAGEQADGESLLRSPRRLSFFNSRHFLRHPSVMELLLSLVAEVPLNLLRPDSATIDRLIDWLRNRSQTSFTHLLARCILSRFSWEAIVDVDSDETFLPLKSHLDLALALAQLMVDCGSSHLKALSLPPAVSNVWSTTSSSASSAISFLLGSIGYRQFQLVRSGSTDTQKDFLIRSRPMFSHSPAHSSRRSRSQGPETEFEENTDSAHATISWCIDLLLRLHLPGCAAKSDQPVANLSPANFRNMWSMILSINRECNPLAAFLILSMYVGMFDKSLYLPAGIQLSNLTKTIIGSQQAKLILRTFFLLFRQLASSCTVSEYPEFCGDLARILRLCQRNQMYPRCGSQFLQLLVGSCLDSCLCQPYSCHNLLCALIRALTTTTCLANANAVAVLEMVLQIAVWIRHSYIPLHLGTVSNLTNWTDDEVVAVLRTAVLAMYTERCLGPAVGWSSQLAVIGSVAWKQSARLVHELKGRLIGLPTVANKLDVHARQDISRPHCSIGMSIIGMFWSPLVASASISGDDRLSAGNEVPFWLLTLMHLMDHELQTVQSPAESVEETKYTLRSIWSCLIQVLSRHIPELTSLARDISVSTKHPESPENYPLPQNLRTFLEKVLIETDTFPVLSLSEARSTDVNRSADQICSLLQQLCIVQGISLLHACPLEDPVCVVLLHAICNELLGFRMRSTKLSAGNPSPRPFLGGVLLLRCLPWSAFRLQPGPSNQVQDADSVNQRSLYDVLIERLEMHMARLASMNELTVELSKLLSVFKNLHNLLSGLDSVAMKGTFLPVERNTFSPEPRHQMEVIDALLDVFDWREQTRRLQFYIDLWHDHRISSVSPLNPAREHPKGACTSLHRTVLDERRRCLPYYSLTDLIAGSVSATLPKSVSQFPRSIQDRYFKLAQCMKFICDRMELVDQLQSNHRTSLLPKLYRITQVKKSEQVQCRSIIPSWISGSKGCQGGARLLCEYHTAKLDPKIAQNALENRRMVQELLDAVVSESVYTAVATLNEDVLDWDHPDRKCKWARVGLELEFTVKRLVELARTSRLTADQRNLPSSKDDDALYRIGVACFEDLCRCLSGPLLLCPVSKKLISHCIQHLAEEFLPSLTAGYERVLDLLVALPHLSNVLLPAFIPPAPGSIAFRDVSDQQHPLTSVYTRVMDVKFRCGPDVALGILKTINTSSWFTKTNQTIPIPANRLVDLCIAVCKCIKETANTDDRDADRGIALHVTLLEHLESIYVNFLSDLFIPVCYFLFEDFSNSHCLPIWISLCNIIENDIANRGELFLSIEQLSIMLDSLADRLSKPSAASTRLHPTLSDELLHCGSHDMLKAVLHILHILLRELGVKLGHCVREKHTTVAIAAPSLWEHWLSTFGLLITKSATTAFRSFDFADLRGHSAFPDIVVSLQLTATVLKRAVQACPESVSAHWSSALFDSFVYWLVTTPCVNTATTEKSSHSGSSRPSNYCLSAVMPAAAVFACFQSFLGSETSFLQPLYDLFESGLSWQPTISTLDALIKLLVESRSYSRPFSAASLAELIIPFFEQVRFVTHDSHALVPLYPVVDQQLCSWDSSIHRSTECTVAYAETVVYLCVLLCRSMLDAPSEAKNKTQVLLEYVLANMHLSEVNDRFYQFLISHFTGSEWPLHFILMPPTSMEGRLLGLMASAAAMISEPSFTESQLYTSASHSKLYPSLPEVPSVVTIVPVCVHSKRLAYVRMIVNLLQWTLRRGASHVDSLLLRAVVGTCFPQSVPCETVNESKKSNLISYLSGPIGALFGKFISTVPGNTGIPTCSATDTDPLMIFDILSWFRFGNLLSEIEAVAAPVAWKHPMVPAFKQISELCHDVFSLLVSLESQTASTVHQSKPPLCDAILRWLVGNPEFYASYQSKQLHLLCGELMPRSINAGLSLPIFHTVLSLASKSQKCLPELVLLLEATIWSALNFGPVDLNSIERLDSFLHVIEDSSDSDTGILNQITFNQLVHGCLQEGALLPIVVFNLSRMYSLDDVQPNSDSLDIFVADLVHWLTLTNIRYIAEGSTIRLFGFLLFIGMLLKTLSARSAAIDVDGKRSRSCCSSHPAWSPIASRASTSCGRAVLAANLLTAFSNVRNSLTRLRSCSKGNEDISRFVSFIDCTGSLLEAWLGSAQPRIASFNLLCRQGETATTESSRVTKNDPTRDTDCIMSVLRIRLPSWTLNEAVRFIITQFWPHLHESLQEILSDWLS